MYCPVCRSEFLEGVIHCANCEVDLVGSIPDEDILASPEAMARALKGKELHAVMVGNHVALREAQRVLSNDGIPSVISGEAENTEVDPGMHARFFLMVEAQRLGDTARSFHHRAQQGLELEGLMVGEGAEPQLLADDRCPACGTPIADNANECPECGLFLGAS